MGLVRKWVYCHNRTQNSTLSKQHFYDTQSLLLRMHEQYTIGVYVYFYYIQATCNKCIQILCQSLQTLHVFIILKHKTVLS